VPEEAAFVFDRDWVAQHLPHRPPFLFIDGVQAIKDGVLCARFDVDQTQQLFAAHFPNAPSWPGAIQIEAMAEAAFLLYLADTKQRPSEVAAGVVREAKFMRPVRPGRSVQLLGSYFEDGLWITVVGQVLQHGHVCAASIGSILRTYLTDM